MQNSGLFHKFYKINKTENSNPSSFESWAVAKSKKMDDMVNSLFALILNYQEAATPESKAEILLKIKEMYSRIRDFAKMNSLYFEARNLFMKAEHSLISANIDPLKIEDQIKEQKKMAKGSSEPEST